jgi:nucleoporin p58/p45
MGNSQSTSTSQPPAAGGAFGGGTAAATTQAPAATGGGLFGSGTATSQAPVTPSAFGGALAATQPQKSASLFGTSTSAATQSSATPSLFGGSTAVASTPAQSTTGGLFGGLKPSQPQQQQQATGAFGSTLGQPAKTGGLFGLTTPQPQQQQVQQQSTGGLFGATQPAQTQQTGGLFGQQPQQQQAQQQGTGGLFGSRTLGGTSAFGQSAPAQGFGLVLPEIKGSKREQKLTSYTLRQSQPQSSILGPGLSGSQFQNSQTVPGVRIDISNIKGTTRFNDLHEDIQAKIARIDQVIETCIAQKNELDAFMPAHGEQVTAIAPDVRFISRKEGGVTGALNGDAQAVKALQDLVKVDADHARLSFKAVDNLKLPAQYHTAGLWSTRGHAQGAAPTGSDSETESSDLIGFFSTTADEMRQTMDTFDQNLSDIETHLRGLEASLREQMGRLVASSRTNGHSGPDDRVAELAGVLTEFEGSILQVAGQVGGAREKMTELQLKGFA